MFVFVSGSMKWKEAFKEDCLLKASPSIKLSFDLKPSGAYLWWEIPDTNGHSVGHGGDPCQCGKNTTIVKISPVCKYLDVKCLQWLWQEMGLVEETRRGDL
jgi:hypothetical protein